MIYGYRDSPENSAVMAVGRADSARSRGRKRPRPIHARWTFFRPEVFSEEFFLDVYLGVTNLYLIYNEEEN